MRLLIALTTAALLACSGTGTGGAGGGSGGSSGGATAGGASAGGATAGGATAGGSAAGGSTAGGSTAGGSTAGGSTAGGSTAGGSTAGGSTAGGSTAGGSTAGGSTAGGSSGPVIWVDDAAPNDTGSGSAASPKKLIASGIALLPSSGGGTVIIKAGTYAGAGNAITTLKAGTASAWNVIKAEVDGTVTITSALAVPAGDWYTQLEGLKWKSSSSKEIRGGYQKYLRCAFEGGPATGNAVTLQIGTNDTTPGARFILIEDSWVYGPGGRYKVIVYNSDGVILRRVVGRHDGGWTYDQQNPQGVFSIYESRNVRVQNAIALDTATNLQGYEADFYGPANQTTSTPYDNVRWQGCMSFDGPNNAFAVEGAKAVTACAVEDFVSYNTAQGIAHNGSSAKAVTYTRITKIGGAYGFARWNGSGAMSPTHSIIKNSGTAFQTGATNGGFNNTFGTSTGGAITTDPQLNGLSYPVRIESGTPLKTAGMGGAQVGAEVNKRVGVSGTLFGEPGFEAVTGDDLWPWPNQARLKADMASVSTRGFCAAGQSFTRYLFERLGSSSPYP